MPIEIIPANWPAPEHIHAFTTTRIGGVSQKPLDELNLGEKTSDDAHAVAVNRARLNQFIGQQNQIFWLEQMHANKILNLDESVDDACADASFTRQPHQVCAILTADCLPILLCDQKGEQVAAIHAGWRGLHAGVIDDTLKTFHCPKDQLLAWLGPAIGPQKFEIQADVYTQFVDQWPETKNCFQRLNQTHWLCNIFQLAKFRLKTFGVKNVYGGQFCTYTDKNRFYSHRRDHGETGRMASLIWIES